LFGKLPDLHAVSLKPVLGYGVNHR
jgi:hypothetical protein